MFMSEYGSPRSQRPANANFEPGDVRVIFLTETKCKIRLTYVRFNCKRRKVG